MRTRTLLQISIVVSLLCGSVGFAQAQKKSISAGLVKVTGFLVRSGQEVGIYFRSNSDLEPTLYRLCAPNQPAMDSSYYFYDLAKLALSSQQAVDLSYIESSAVDPVTKRNKLCVDTLIY